MTDDLYVYDSNESDTTFNETSDNLNVSKLTHYPDVITASYIGVLVLLGVLTNGVVCYVYLRLMTGSMITRPFQPFIVTMSSADLLCCLFAFPIDMFIILTPWAPSHLSLWVFSSVVISVCTTLDVLMLVALNTIRYFSVMYPSRTIGRKATVTALVATLMMSCVVNVPFIFMYGVVMINSKDDYIILCESPVLVDNVYVTTQLVLYLIVMTCLLHQNIQLAWYVSNLTQNGRLVSVMSKRLPVSGISRTYIFGSVRPSIYLRNKKRKSSDVYRASSRQRLIASFHRDRKNSKYLKSSRSHTCLFLNTSPEFSPAAQSANKLVLDKDPRIREKETLLKPKDVLWKILSKNPNAQSEDSGVHKSHSSERRGKSGGKKNKKEKEDNGKEKKKWKLGSEKRKGKELQSPSGKTTIPIITILSCPSQDEFQDMNVVWDASSTARSLRSFQQMWEEGRQATSLSVLKRPASRSSPFRVLRKHVKVKIKDRTLLSLGITTAVFFVSYTPFLVLLAMCHNRVLIPTNHLELSAVGILQRSTYILTALNAIIYNLFNEGFWHRIRLYRKRLLRRFCCKG